MNAGEIFLLLLGPALALAAGLAIYGIAIRSKRSAGTVRTTDSR